MNKTNKITCRCQHKSCKQAPFCLYFEPKWQDPKIIEEYFSTHPDECRAYNLLLSFSNKFQHIYCSQSLIALCVGVTRETINRWMKKWRELGFLGSVSRLWRTCIYYLPTIFNNAETRQRLSYLFNALYAPMSMRWLVVTLPMIFTMFSEQRLSLPTSGPSNLGITLHSKEVIINSKSHALAELRDGRSTPGLTTSAVEYEGEHKSEGSAEQKESEMELIPPSSTIQGLNCFKLTKIGMARLSCFPDEAIEYAKSVYVRTIIGRDKTLKDPFSYFCKICWSYCREKGIRVDQGQSHQLLKAMGASPDAPSLIVPTRLCQDNECAIERSKQGAVPYCENLEHPEVDGAWLAEQEQKRQEVRIALKRHFGVKFPDEAPVEPTIELIHGFPRILVEESLIALIPKRMDMKKTVLGYADKSWSEFMNIDLDEIIAMDSYKASQIIALQDEYDDFAHHHGVTRSHESTKMPRE